MTIHQNLIAGEWTGAAGVNNINPSDTNEVVGVYAAATTSDVADAIAAAKASPLVPLRLRWAQFHPEEDQRRDPGAQG